ncbi:MAG TPA: DUF4097 family beta strand repeat-containing protein [Melioribacteraceae bacterium]|nr:DUF4097 family beta strand repeat-containing protein [Melioribacteraceae bacterium]
MKNLLFVVFVFLFSLNLLAEDLKLLQEKSFNVNKGEKLFLSAGGGGDVIIKSWDKNEVNVKVYGNKKAESKMDFTIEKKEMEVYVKGERKGSGFFSSFSNIRLKYTVMVPNEYMLELKTSGGDIKIDFVSGLKKLSTSGGDIELSSTKGSVSASTSGGDIVVDNTEGDISVSTSGGDIKLKTVNSKIEASTSGGDVLVELRGENKGIDLSTSGGDIKLLVEKSIKADLELRTAGGDISVNIPLTSTEKISSSKFIGKCNDGGNSIKATTSGGDIAVKEIN